MIQLGDERYWLYAAVDPDSNDLLHEKLEPARTNVFAHAFFAELRKKHDVEDAVFLVDGAPWLHEALCRHGRRFHHGTYGNRNAIKRLYEETK